MIWAICCTLNNAYIDLFFFVLYLYVFGPTHIPCEHSRDMLLKWEWHKFFYSLVCVCVLQWNVLLFRQFFSSFSWCIWKYRLIYTPQWSIYKIKVENGFKPLTRPSIYRFIVSTRFVFLFFLSLFLFVAVNVWVNFVFALSALFLRVFFFFSSFISNKSHGIPESILPISICEFESILFMLFNEEYKKSRYSEE